MGRDIFLEGHLKGLTLDEILATYDDAVKDILADKIRKLGKCKIERPVFGFLSTHPGSCIPTNYEEGDVISSYDELITLAKSERYSETSMLFDYRVGLLKIVPVK